MTTMKLDGAKIQGAMASWVGRSSKRFVVDSAQGTVRGFFRLSSSVGRTPCVTIVCRKRRRDGTQAYYRVRF